MMPNPWDLTAPAALSTLPPPAAAQLQALRVAVVQAWQARNAQALHEAKQQVLRAAWHTAPLPPATRRALRELAWRMCALSLRAPHRACG